MDVADSIKHVPERVVMIRERILGTKNTLGDKIFFAVCSFSALLILVTMVGILVQLFITSQPTVSKFGISFLTSSDWDTVNEKFGALPFIYGTLVSSILGLLLSLPLSLGIAIFLVEIAPQGLRTLFSFLVETLAAIPSVVYGVWGVFVMVPWLQQYVGTPLAESFGTWIPFLEGPAIGPSMLSAAMILSIMCIPIITSISRDVMLAIPLSQREAALALGSTKWESIRVVVSNARWGILGAVILGLGRALGETMAVTMVIGNSTMISKSILMPAYSMASVIANELNEAVSDLHTSALIEIGMLLLVTTFIVNILARLLVWSVTRNSAGAK